MTKPAIIVCDDCGDAHWADRNHDCGRSQNDPSDCEHCDGFGAIWNNADPTSGQFIACECGDVRGLP